MGDLLFIIGHRNRYEGLAWSSVSETSSGHEGLVIYTKPQPIEAAYETLMQAID